MQVPRVAVAQQVEPRREEARADRLAARAQVVRPREVRRRAEALVERLVARSAEARLQTRASSRSTVQTSATALLLT